MNDKVHTYERIISSSEVGTGGQIWHVQFTVGAAGYINALKYDDSDAFGILAASGVYVPVRAF